MKVTISETKEVNEAFWKKLKIWEGHGNKRLIIDGPEFRVMLWEDRVHIKYTFHRPDHDHNNTPAIQLDIPKNGARASEDAVLTVHSDSGYYPDLFLDWGYGKKQELKPVHGSGGTVK